MEATTTRSGYGDSVPASDQMALVRSTEASRARWRFKVTPFRLVLGALVVVAIVLAALRFIYGLGAYTNLNDSWPWGLWIGFDLLCGIALAGGGFSTALIVHVLHRDEYRPIARAALLTSLLGYIIALASLLLDVGRWPNFWRPFFFWGYESVLFEVFWCISLYTLVQVLEFGDIFFEKVKVPAIKRVLHRLMTPLLIIGIVLPTLHQSSLGSLYIVTVDRLNPLWWSMLLPVFFVWSAFFLGPAMVTLEGTLASKVYRRKPELPVFRSMTRITLWMLIAYFIMKVVDVASRGVLPAAFNGSFQSNMFLAEMLLFVLAPIILYAIPAVRATQAGLVTASALVVVGVIFNRLNVVFTGMADSVSGSYFPAVTEILITLGMWSFLVLAYLFVVENFSIFPSHAHEAGSAEPNATTEDREASVAAGATVSDEAATPVLVRSSLQPSRSQNSG